MLTKERKEIVDLPLRSLLLRLKKGEHKPRQVLRAYQVLQHGQFLFRVF